ncbi:MAG: hypothetical protein H7Z21_18430 [Hymenobacter sp.]|nr:hypothetical protein [Hymenobacter sp.]
MKYTLEIPEYEASFVLEFLRRVTSVKVTPVPGPSLVTEQDTTDYLLGNPANARKLRESIDQARRDEVLDRPLLPAE